MIDLLPRQKQAKDKLLENKVGALFMKMGAGKTRVAVELVNSVPGTGLVVWVGPLRTIDPLDKSIRSVKDEIAKWGGFNCANVIYIGIETIQASDRQFLQLYNQVRTAWQCFMIIDESIKIKNNESKRTKRMLQLGAMVDYKLILNGEPVVRDLMDIWAQMEFLSPKILRMQLADFENTNQFSNRGRGEKHVIKMRAIADELPGMDTKTDMLSWKRMTMAIIKNDITCKSLSFGVTKHQILKRQEIINKYKNL